jgi:hypothetical protein
VPGTQAGAQGQPPAAAAPAQGDHQHNPDHPRNPDHPHNPDQQNRRNGGGGQ